MYLRLAFVIASIVFWGAILIRAASANDITVTLTDNDQNVVTQALDSYVKMGGLGVATNAVLVLQKLIAAKNAPPQKDKTDAPVPEVKPAP